MWGKGSQITCRSREAVHMVSVLDECSSMPVGAERRERSKRWIGSLERGIQTPKGKQIRYGAPAPNREGQAQGTHGREGVQSVGLWCSSLCRDVVPDWPSCSVDTGYEGRLPATLRPIGGTLCRQHLGIAEHRRSHPRNFPRGWELDVLGKRNSREVRAAEANAD